MKYELGREYDHVKIPQSSSYDLHQDNRPRISLNLSQTVRSESEKGDSNDSRQSMISSQLSTYGYVLPYVEYYI
jgi:hypothetical protein